jgi:uncharacterized delta-60 repeat protein
MRLKGKVSMTLRQSRARWAFLALALSAGTAACSGTPADDDDGGGGEDGSGGGSEDGSGGESEDGSGGVETGGTGGSSGGSENLGGGGLGGLGGAGGSETGGSEAGGSGGSETGGTGGGETGGTGGGDNPPIFVQEKAFLLDNAINPYGTLIASDGKIYISGTTDTGVLTVNQDVANLRLAVWRLNADGSLDATWGTNGKLTSTIVNPGTSYSIAELADGSFVVHYSGGIAGVSLVGLSAAGVFGTPTSLVFGWSEAHRTEVDTLCVPAAATAEADAHEAAALTGGVCHAATLDQTACNALNAASLATPEAVACLAVWPAATSPLFAQRPTTPAQETSWGFALDSSGAQEKIVLAVSSSAKKVTTGTQRTDTDRYITRVLASDFSFDTTFNGGSQFTLDVSNLGLNDNSRRVIVEEDGAIVTAGYTNIGAAFPGPTPAETPGNTIALIRLLPNGTADPDFGFTTVDGADFNPGQTLHMPFLGASAGAEAYGVTQLSTGTYVTTGYGTSNFDVPSISVDLVTTAYSPEVDQDGLDPQWGGNLAGVVGGFAVQSETDPNAGVSGTNPYMDRGRNVVALLDDRTVHGGVYDDLAAFYVLTPDGALDETVGNGTGRIQYAFPFAFFGLTATEEGDRIVGATQSKARVNAAGTNPGSYAKSLVAIVDLQDLP